jgi:hypothetical protein
VRLLDLLEEKIVMKVRDSSSGHENHLSIDMVELLIQNLTLGRAGSIFY